MRCTISSRSGGNYDIISFYVSLSLKYYRYSFLTNVGIIEGHSPKKRREWKGIKEKGIKEMRRGKKEEKSIVEMRREK